MGIGDSWGTREELLHPRGKNGRFIRKLAMSPAIVDMVRGLLDGFAPRTFPSNGAAGQWAQNRAKPSRFNGGSGISRFKADYDNVQEDLRDGVIDDPSTKKYVSMMEASMVELPDDIIVSRVVGPDSFGMTPEQMNAPDGQGGIYDMIGSTLADRGYSPTTLGTPLPAGGGNITMVYAVRKGTKAVIPGTSPDDREVILDRNQEFVVTKVKPDGRGGYYVSVVATPRTPGETPRPAGGPVGAGKPKNREAEITARHRMEQARMKVPDEGAGAPIGPERVLNPDAQPSPTGPSPAGPGAPAPRTEQVVSESVGNGGGAVPAPAAPTTTQAPAPTPLAPSAPPAPEAPARPDPAGFKDFVKQEGILSPSRGARRGAWNTAYMAAKGGRKDPDDILRDLDSDIRNFDDPDAKENTVLQEDLASMRQLRDAIARYFGVDQQEEQQAPEPEAPAPAKAAKKAAKKVAAPKAAKKAGAAPAPTEPKAAPAKKASAPEKVVPPTKAAKKAAAEGDDLGPDRIRIGRQSHDTRRSNPAGTPNAVAEPRDQGDQIPVGRGSFVRKTTKPAAAPPRDVEPPRDASDVVAMEEGKESFGRKRKKGEAGGPVTRLKPERDAPLPKLPTKKEREQEDEDREALRRLTERMSDDSPLKKGNLELLEQMDRDAEEEATFREWIKGSGVTERSLTPVELAHLGRVASDLDSGKISRKEAVDELKGIGNDRLTKIANRLDGGPAVKQPRKPKTEPIDELDKMTVPELKKAAKEAGVTGYSKLLKQPLKDAIRNKRNDKEAPKAPDATPETPDVSEAPAPVKKAGPAKKAAAKAAPAPAAALAPPATVTAPESATVNASSLKAGERIRAIQNDEGQWVRTARKTGGARVITVTKIDREQIGRTSGTRVREQSGYKITGVDDDGNEITLQPIFGQNSLTREGAPAAKKAAPAKKAVSPVAARRQQALDSLREQGIDSPSQTVLEEQMRTLADTEARDLIRSRSGGKAAPTPRQVELDNKVREAYRDLRSPGEWVGLADLREHKALSGMSRAEQDEAIKGIISFGDLYDPTGAKSIRLIPVANKKALTERDRAAAVKLGGEDMDAVSFGDPAPRKAAPRAGDADTLLVPRKRQPAVERDAARAEVRKRSEEALDAELEAADAENRKTFGPWLEAAGVQEADLTETDRLILNLTVEGLRDKKLTRPEAVRRLRAANSPRLNALADQVAIRPTRARAVKATPAAPAAPDDILARLNDFDNPGSREEAAALLVGLKRPQLVQMAKAQDIPRAGTLNMADLRRELVDATVGRRLDSIATRGFRGIRPDLPDTPARGLPDVALRAEEPLKVPGGPKSERAKSFRAAWNEQDIKVSTGSASRSMQEIRSDLEEGKITPDEAVRRMESEIDFEKSDLAETDVAIRDLTALPKRDAEQQAELDALKDQKRRLQSNIKGQEKAASFLRRHFNQEPVRTDEEIQAVKVNLPGVSKSWLDGAKPEDMQEAAKEVGLDAPKGDTAEEMFDDLLRQVIEKELADRAAKKATKAAKKAAPAKKVAPAATPSIPTPKVTRHNHRPGYAVFAENAKGESVAVGSELPKTQADALARRIKASANPHALVEELSAANLIAEAAATARRQEAEAATIAARPPIPSRADMGKMTAPELRKLAKDRGTPMSTASKGHIINTLAEEAGEAATPEAPAAAPAKKAAKKAAPAASTGPKLSDKPIVKNTWGGESSQVHFHDDGIIGMALKDMSREDWKLEVDGDALANVVGRIATDGVMARKSPQEVVDALKKVVAKLPQGPAKKRLADAAAELDAPKRAALPLPDDTPAPIKKLMDELADIPLARTARVGSEDGSEMDRLQDIARRFASGELRPMMLIQEIRYRIQNGRHESEEGKFDIDRAVTQAIKELDAMKRDLIKRPAETPAPAKAAKKAVKKATDDQPSDAEISRMTIPELRELAARRGMPNADEARKDDLLDFLFS